MTIATILGYMELLDNELETGSGEDDEATAITALNVAQDHFEIVAANYPTVYQNHTSLSTTANAETTTYPSDLLRLDSIWAIGSDSLPSYELDQINDTGGHRFSLPWPFRMAVGTVAPGAPKGYWTTEQKIYWSPVPDAVYSLRVYGFTAASDFATRSATYAYRDHTAFALATFACKVLSLGVGDDTADLETMATEVFTPVIRQARRFHRSGPIGREYTRVHVT